MKRCPSCEEVYSDETLKFCRIDGAILEELEHLPTRILEKPNKHSTQAGPRVPTGAKPSRITGKLIPETKYAKSGDINIAYQVLGNGALDLIYVPGWVSHLEYGWEEPSLARFYHRLASFSRLILFDKRGTGLSDQSTDLPTLEQRMDDVRAVMQAVGSERAVVFGMSEGGNMAMLFAATYPERTVALITFGVFAKRVYDPSYPWAPTPAQRQQFYDAIEREWGGPMGLDDLAPSKVHDERFRQWWATYQRRSAPPGAALALARMNTQIDVRHVLPAIKVPTLVMHRSKDRDSHVEEGRYIATQIPGARFVELPGEDHLLFVGDQDQVLNEVEKFVETVGPGSNVDCVLATVLCVLTTVQNENEISRFYALARREIGWFKGRLNNSNDHEIKATFDGPIRAIKCAKAIRDAANAIGIETKAGLHTGLCEMTADQASGITVEISRRVAVHAAPGEVLLTNNIMELVSGSGLDFTTKDDRQVEGLFDDGPLFAIN